MTIARAEKGSSKTATLVRWMVAIAALLSPLLVTACGTTGPQNAQLALQPIPQGKARLTIKRTSSLLYSGVPATITLDGKNAASLGTGSSTVLDLPAGNHVLAASAWSYPGTFSVKLAAEAGKTYAIEIAPRTASFGPSAVLGPLGGLIDASVNENAGAFQMRFVEE